MIRALLNAVVFFVLTLVGCVVSILLGLLDRSGGSVLVLSKVWSRMVLACAGVKLEIRYHGRVDRSRPYVVMSNHLSSVDIWALFVALPFPVRFIAKKQLSKVPIFGWALRAGRFIFIDRQNPAAARRTIQEAARRIKDGASVIIFPEGTRSRSGKLMPFKKGGFHLAISSGCDILPVAIRGSEKVMPPGSLLIRAGVVSVDIGAPVSLAGKTESDRDELLGRVRSDVRAMLGQPEDDEDVAMLPDLPGPADSRVSADG